MKKGRKTEIMGIIVPLLKPFSHWIVKEFFIIWLSGIYDSSQGHLKCRYKDIKKQVYY